MVESKSRWKRLIAFTLAFAMVFSSIAVSSFSAVTVQAAPSKTVKGVTLKIGSKDVTKKTFGTTLYNEDQKQLKVVVSPKKAVKKVTYKSAKPKIAYVNKNGVITGKRAGTAKINVTVVGKDKKKTKTWVKVNVKDVKLTLKDASVEVGKTAKLNVSCTPNRDILKWETSDKSIATVKDGAVTGKKAGTATITARRGVKKATCKVTVKESGIAVTDVEATIEPSSEISVGRSAQIVANVLPENATNKEVTYSSSDANIASVDPETGVVVGEGEGEAVITVHAANGKTAEVKVTVTFVEATEISIDPAELTLGVEESKELTATIEPENASVTQVSWNSLNPEFATVDATGNVKAIAVGKATIVATVKDKNGENGPEAQCVVEVADSDRLAIELVDPYEENTVLYGKPMNLRVKVVRDNQPVANDNIRLAIDSIYDGKDTDMSRDDNGDYQLANNYGVTNAEGYAEFTVFPTKSNLSAISKQAKAEVYSFTATEAASGKKNKLDVNTAVVKMEGISVNDNVNFNSVENVYSIPSLGGWNQEYVAARDISQEGQENNSIEFTTGAEMQYGKSSKESLTPTWTTDGKVLSANSVYNQYSGETTSTLIQGMPAGITKITLNFDKDGIKVSDSARIHIVVEAIQPNGKKIELVTKNIPAATLKDTNWKGNFTVNGEDGLDNNTDCERRLIVSIITEGRVSGAGESYVLKSIEGTGTANAEDKIISHPLPDGTVEWALTSDVTRSEENLTDGQKTEFGLTTANAKYTYTIPVYPYTGDAFITETVGNQTKTFAYPISDKTENDETKNVLVKKSNLNIVDTEIGNEEATKAVNTTVKVSGNNVIVNATEAGKTELKATLNIDGLTETEFNAGNGKELYTSVQWTKAKENPENDYYAVEGQTVTVRAKLSDATGKAISKEKIKFTVNGTEVKTSVNQPINESSENKVFLIQDQDKNGTNEQGEVVLKFLGEANSVIEGLKAEPATPATGKKVNLSIDHSGGTTSINDGANIYWVDLGLQYQDSVSGINEAEETPTPNYKDEVLTLTEIETKVGETWKIGYKPIATAANSKVTAVNDVSIKYTASSDKINELSESYEGKAKTFAISTNQQSPEYYNYITADDKIATVTSTKNIKMYLDGKIDTSDLNKISFKVEGVETPYINVGQGVSPSLTRTGLKLPIQWQETKMKVQLNSSTIQSVTLGEKVVIEGTVVDDYNNVYQTSNDNSMFVNYEVGNDHDDAEIKNGRFKITFDAGNAGMCYIKVAVKDKTDSDAIPAEARFYIVPKDSTNPDPTESENSAPVDNELQEANANAEVVQ